MKFVLLSVLVFFGCSKRDETVVTTTIKELTVNNSCYNIDSHLYVNIQYTDSGQLISAIEFGGSFGKVIRVYDDSRLVYISDKIFFKKLDNKSAQRIDCAELIYPKLK